MLTNFLLPAKIPNARVLIAYNNQAILERFQAGMKIKDVFDELTNFVEESEQNVSMTYETFRRLAPRKDQPKSTASQDGFKAEESNAVNLAPTPSKGNSEGIDPTEQHNPDDLF